MHRTPSAPRSPNPKMDTAESSALKQSTVICFRLPKRRSIRLTPLALVPIVDKADEMILQDTLQDNDEPNISGTRLEPKSDKESLEVEITNDEEVEITNVVILVNVNEKEEEITDEVYELKRREKGKIVEESRSTPFPTTIRSPRIHIDLVSLDTEKLQELTGRYTYLFEHLKTRFLSRKSFDTLVDHLQEVMVESLPTMVDTHIKEQVKRQVHEQVKDQVPVLNVPHKFRTLLIITFLLKLMRQPSAVRPKDQGDPHDDAHPEGENRAKRQKTSEYEAYVFGESSSGSGPEKFILSLHKFLAIIFNDDDIEEQTSRWVNKHVRKLNPCARYGVEHWKNPHAKIFYIRKQKEPGKPKEVIYSNSKIIQIIKTYWELGHEHKFITEIVARRANECILSITKPDYKNLNKNDIKDMYLLIMNGKVPDYAETGLLWSLSVFIRSSVLWERVHAFQLGIESYQQKVNLTAPTI
ncbi:hypothetical protein Tco_0865953 [Tanacetum coccineum]